METGAQLGLRIAAYAALAALCLMSRTRPVEAAAVQQMADIKVFAFGGVGFAGATSSGEAEYRRILTSDRPESDFTELFRRGNLEEKCYALVGMQKVNPQKFRELSAPLRTEHAKVTTMGGCVMSSEPVSQIIRSIEAGFYANL